MREPANRYLLAGIPTAGGSAQRFNKGGAAVWASYSRNVVSGPLDGSLHRWEDIASECDWRTLFIGNGLSINIWPDFRYDTLFRFAALYPSDEALFAYEGTPNFEVVLADLNTTTNVGRLCGLDARALERVEQRYRRIQEALARNVQ